MKEHMEKICPESKLRIRRFGNTTVAVIYIKRPTEELCFGYSRKSNKDNENRWIGKFIALSRAMKVFKRRGFDFVNVNVDWKKETYIPEFMSILSPLYSSQLFCIFDKRVLEFLKLTPKKEQTNDKKENKFFL